MWWPPSQIVTLLSEALEVATPLFDTDPARTPPDNQLLLTAMYATELVAAFGVRPASGKLYVLLLPFADQAVVSGVAITFKGAVAHHLGVLAATLDRAADAVGHLEQAIALHERIGAVTWVLRGRYELACMRLGDPARRAAAVAALADVASEANRIGMLRLSRDAEQAGLAARQAPVSSGVFTRDGALWTLSYGGTTVRMRNAKGLADLAVLLGAAGPRSRPPTWSRPRRRRGRAGRPAAGRG